MIHQVEQNSEEWFALRHGKVTASNFGTIMANFGKALGNPAKQYAMRVAVEGKTGRNVETFKNEWMERGIELEDEARNMYSDMTFETVEPGGFAELGRLGASSDGLVGTDGMIEIKCVKYSTHFERFLKNDYDSSYQWQIRGQMLVYDRQWCDFVSYCPDFPLDKQLFIHRIHRDKVEEEKLISRLKEFEQLLNSYIKILN